MMHVTGMTFIWSSRLVVQESRVKGFDVEGRKVAISHTKTGYFAFKDECPHNRVKLSEGICNIYDEVVCPWHNYRFDLKTGNETSGHGHYLRIYHIEISDEGVYLVL